MVKFQRGAQWLYSRTLKVKGRTETEAVQTFRSREGTEEEAGTEACS